MTHIPETTSDPEKPRVTLHVLLTGFGPFGDYVLNPSWDSVQHLHERVFYGKAHNQVTDIRVQSINLPVFYHSTLDTVPRLHGNLPLSPYARADFDRRGPQEGQQGLGSSFPEGWSVDVPDGRCFDAIIHVGVGARGAFKLESQAHKDGYLLPDASGRLAPPTGKPNLLRKLRHKMLAFMHKALGVLNSCLPAQWRLTARRPWLRALYAYNGGFGEGYEDSPSVMSTDLNVDALVERLAKLGHQPVASSTDPGRYVCDFTYYTSLVAASQRGGRNKTKVLFVHIPPAGQPHGIDACVRMLEDLIPAVMWHL
ncbi:unnamed protein product [Parajaminaea phylloscopi]